MRTNIRVAGIIIENNQLLTVEMKNIIDGLSTFVIPGGGVNYDEDIYKALKREMKEELDIDIIDFHLSFIKELYTDDAKSIEFYFCIDKYIGEIKKGFDTEVKSRYINSVSFIQFDKLVKLNFFPKQIIEHLINFNRNSYEINHLGIFKYPE